MQLHIKQLEQLKNKPLLPVYLINSDVPLLIQEACDTIRKTASMSGFNQRELFTVEPSFNWNQFSYIAENFNLFSEKTLLEIRNPKTRFDHQGNQVLLRYLENIPEDKLLLIVTGKITSTQQKTKWFKAIDKVGAIITIWPVNLRELPAWITARFQRAGLRADSDSIQLLAELTEGNLLSTQQAIEKLSLLYPNTLITTNEVTEVVSDNARFKLFDLTNYALAGSPKRALRILTGLRLCGTEITLILWSFTRELRELYSMAKQLEQGIPITKLLATQWQSRKPLVKNALSRLTSNELNQLLQHAQYIDTLIKGVTLGDPWQALESLCLCLSGKNNFPLRTSYAKY